MEKTVDVLIIGAGFAGLSAARKLQECGITNFHVLEARARTGGRVDTGTFEGFEVTIGPFYVHGKENNPIAEIIKELKLPLHPSNGIGFGENSTCARLSVTGQDVSKEFTLVSKVHKEAMAKVMAAAHTDTDISAAEVYQRCGWNPSTSVQQAYDALHNDMYCGFPAHITSGHSEKVYNIGAGDGDNHKDCVFLVPDGYRRVIKHLMDRAQIDSTKRLSLSTSVERIVWSSSTQRPQFAEVFTFSDSEGRCRWYAKHVIITVPPPLLFPLERPDSPGLLDAHIAFEPPLPEEKQKALRLISKGI